MLNSRLITPAGISEVYTDNFILILSTVIDHDNVPEGELQRIGHLWLICSMDPRHVEQSLHLVGAQ